MTAPRKLVLGHRGYPPRALENTLESALLALAAGADGLEFDVQKTRDAYIVFHDADLSRLAGRPEAVADIDATVWRHTGLAIPELGEWLDALPKDVLLNLELKEETLSPADAEALDALIRAHGNPANVLVSSFEHRLLPPWRDKGYRTALLFDQRHIGPGAPSLGALARHYRPWSFHLPVQAFEHLGRLRSRVVAWWIRRVLGVKILVWTVNTEQQLALVWRLCDGVITNETELALQFRSRAR